LLGGQGVVGAALQAEVVDEEKQVPLAELACVRFLILRVIRQRLMSVRIWARIPPGRAPRIGGSPEPGDAGDRYDGHDSFRRNGALERGAAQ
jgi:hypothetical protein